MLINQRIRTQMEVWVSRILFASGRLGHWSRVPGARPRAYLSLDSDIRGKGKGGNEEKRETQTQT
jgi:hypothetical protein